MTIELQGFESDSIPNLTDRAFAKPAADAHLYWWFSQPFLTNYQPYLIKATSLQNENELWFRGVNLTNPNEDFGRNATTDYFVDLRTLAHVYRPIPSTLAGLEPGGAHAYAVLFLSKAFIDDNDELDGLKAARGGPKYPQSADATIRELKSANSALTEKYDKLAAKYQNALQTLKSIMKETTALQNLKLEQWQEDSTP